jgi:hypothetical protein
MDPGSAAHHAAKAARCAASGARTAQRADPMGTSRREQDAPHEVELPRSCECGRARIAGKANLLDQFKVVNLNKVASINFVPFVWRPEFMFPSY